MEDTTKVDAESTMPEADSEEAVSEVDKKVKVPKSKRFGKKESAKQPVKDKLKADKPKVVKSKSKKSVKNKDISNDNNTSNEYRQPGLKMSIKARLIASSVLPTVVGITVVLIIAIVNMSAGMNAEASNGLVLLAEEQSQVMIIHILVIGVSIIMVTFLKVILIFHRSRTELISLQMIMMQILQSFMVLIPR